MGETNTAVAVYAGACGSFPRFRAVDRRAVVRTGYRVEVAVGGLVGYTGTNQLPRSLVRRVIGEIELASQVGHGEELVSK